MATAIQYALMAGASYISTRAPINRFPIPEGWDVVTNPPHFQNKKMKKMGKNGVRLELFTKSTRHLMKMPVNKASPRMGIAGV